MSDEVGPKEKVQANGSGATKPQGSTPQQNPTPTGTQKAQPKQNVASDAGTTRAAAQPNAKSQPKPQPNAHAQRKPNRRPYNEELQRRVREVPFWKSLLLFPLSIGLRIWLRTLRIHISPELRRAVYEEKNPLIIVFWHNRLLFASELHRRFRGWSKINGLVSPSSDGAWLAAFFKMIGIGAVRGSTGRRGGPAMLEIHKKLADGEDIAITPDGPRGPRYKFNPGTALLAQVTHCTVVMVPSKVHCAYRLKTWDGFYIPLPFSRIDIAPKFVPYDKMWDHVPAKTLAEEFREMLVNLTED